jgi:putative peptidoglycan lipid II flippase
MQNTRTPALVNLAAVTINVVADLVLFFGFDLGVQGLALGHATSYAFGSIALLLLIRRRLQGIDGPRVLGTLGRTLVAGGATAASAWLVARWLGSSVGTATLPEQSIQVFSAVATGFVVFVAASTAMRIEEIDAVRRHLVARWRR